MMTRHKYPVYIPSKGRADKPFTIKMFAKEGVDFKVVVEPSQEADYLKFGQDRLLVLPEDGRGLVYSRNWIKDHATAAGHARHWQFDDDIKYISRLYRGYRIRCSAHIAVIAAEDFIDRYENVALASFNSEFFLPIVGGCHAKWPPFYRNSRCYTCFLVLNSLPNRWRHRYNEDTDMSLQVLADGWCTILFNAFLIMTPATMTHGGGQTDIYVNDGRLQMARQLQRVWPKVVTTTRKFKRPQHHVRDSWTKFDTPLRLRPGIDLSDVPPNEYGVKLVQVSDIKSKSMQKLFSDTASDPPKGS